MARETDREFTRIALMPDDLIDLGRASLLIAHDLDPACDVERTIRQLDELAEPLRQLVRAEMPTEEAAELLRDYVFSRLGFHGNEQDYFDPRNSLLHEVLARRTGIPITLSIATLEIAKRCGIPAFGIGFPGHFLVGVGKRERCILLDPFNRGRRLNAQILTELLRGVAGPNARVMPEHLRPTPNRAILARILANLKGVYVRRRDGLHLLYVLDRLVSLVPESATEVRDRGLVYAEMGCFGPARDDLESYLERTPDATDAEEIRGVIAVVAGRAASLN